MFYQGGELSYSFPFDYLQKKFVKAKYVTTDGVTTYLVYGSDYSIENKTILLKARGNAADMICIYRETPTDRQVEFVDASILKAYDFNKFELQLLHITEEISDAQISNSLVVEAVDNAWQGLSRRIKNVHDPVEAQDVVTKNYMETVKGGFVMVNTNLKESAALSERNSKTSETNSKTSETNAKASENASKTSEVNASTSEGKAKLSETNAKTSEVNAKTSETNAKTSETNARTSELNAKASEDKAKASEVNARTSEVNSKTSETNSKTSELAAKQAAVDALAAKNAIAGVYKYCGSVLTYANLPTSGMTAGDTYDIQTADLSRDIWEGDNLAWVVDKGVGRWDNLGGKLKGLVRSVNGVAPDSNGSVTLSITSSGDTITFGTVTLGVD